MAGLRAVLPGLEVVRLRPTEPNRTKPRPPRPGILRVLPRNFLLPKLATLCNGDDVPTAEELAAHRERMAARRTAGEAFIAKVIAEKGEWNLDRDFTSGTD